MREIKAEKLIIKAEKLLKRFIKILWQNKLKLFLALLGVVAITGGVILATGGSFTINKSPELSLTDGLVGYWTFDGDDIAGTTAYDRSGQGNDGTMMWMATSTPTGGRTIGKIGQALDFDGMDDYIDSTRIPELNGATAFTISVWIKPNQVPFVGNQVVFGRGASVRSWIYGDDATSGVDATFFTTDSDYDGYIVNPSIDVVQDVWNHIAYTWNGSTFNAYVNTGFAGTDETAGNTLRNADSDLLIGAYSTFGGTPPVSFFNGSIDEVRVYNRALSTTEINRLYKMGESKLNASQNLKLTDGLVGMWSFDGADIYGANAIDKSGQGNDGVITGATKITGKIGQALEFNGTTSDKVEVGTESDFSDLCVNGCSFSSWVYQNNQALTQVPFGRWETTGDDRFFYMSITSVGRIEFYLAGDGTTDTDVGYYTDTGVMPINEWVYLTVTYDLSDVLLYKNGVYQAWEVSTSFPYEINETAWEDFQSTWIGTMRAGETSNWNGTIDEARFYNRALTTDEITRLYKMGESKLNASQNLKLTDGLVGMWSFNGPDIAGVTAYDRSGQDNNGTIAGATKVIGKIGQGLEFDGSDIVDLEKSLGLVNNFTISAWINGTDYSDEINTIISRGYQHHDYTLYSNPNDTISFKVHAPAGVPYETVSTTEMDIGVWYHVLGTYNGSDVIIYINGFAEGNSGAGGGNVENQYDTLIGACYATSYGFKGVIDEVRIYSRVLSQEEITRLYNMGK